MPKRRQAAIIRHVFQGTILLGTIVACGEPSTPLTDGGAPVCEPGEVGVCAAPCAAGSAQLDGTCAVDAISVTSGCPAGSDYSTGADACVTPRVPLAVSCASGLGSGGCIVAPVQSPGCPAGTVSDLETETCWIAYACAAGTVTIDASTCVATPVTIVQCAFDSSGESLDIHAAADTSSGRCAFTMVSTSGMDLCFAVGGVWWEDPNNSDFGMCVDTGAYVPIRCPAGYAPYDDSSSLLGLPYGVGASCPTCGSCGLTSTPSRCGAGWTGNWHCVGDPVCPPGSIDVDGPGPGGCTLLAASPARDVCPSGSIQIGSDCVLLFATQCPSGSVDVDGECVVSGAQVSQCPSGSTGTPGDCRGSARTCPVNTFPGPDGTCRSPVSSCPPDAYDTGDACVVTCDGNQVAVCVPKWSLE